MRCRKVDECYSTIIVDNDERRRLYLSNEQVGQINVLACLCPLCVCVCVCVLRERDCELSVCGSLYSSRVLFLNCHTLTQTTAGTTEIIKYGPSLSLSFSRSFCHYFSLPLSPSFSLACLSLHPEKFAPIDTAC